MGEKVRIKRIPTKGEESSKLTADSFADVINKQSESETDEHHRYPSEKKHPVCIVARAIHKVLRKLP